MRSRDEAGRVRSPVVSVLVPDPGDLPAGAGPGRVGAAIGAALTSAFPPGDPLVLVVPEGAGGLHGVRCAVAASDLLVVAVPATFPGWRRAAVRLLDAAGPLAGRAVFALVVGGWPESAGRAPAWLEAELRRRDASWLAPVLHLASAAGPSGLAAITAYCAYWRPLVPNLIGFAHRDAVPAAG